MVSWLHDLLIAKSPRIPPFTTVELDLFIFAQTMI